MKKKIFYIIIALIFALAIVMTAVMGLRVDLNFAEGNTIIFTVGKDVNLGDIQNIADEIWGNNKTLVQEVELYGDSALIKTREQITDEQINNLCAKINEKYEVELLPDAFQVEHISNTKLRNVIEPYIFPIGISLLLIATYYAIRFKDAKKLTDLIEYLVISEGLLYSLYAICRVPVNQFTMPIAVLIYALIIIVYSAICEFKGENKQEGKNKKAKNA